jgi:hypothetical protein
MTANNREKRIDANNESIRKPAECEYNMTANHCEKRIDAKNDSLRNQRNAKPTEREYNFSLGKKRIDANKESLRN